MICWDLETFCKYDRVGWAWNIFIVYNYIQWKVKFITENYLHFRGRQFENGCSIENSSRQIFTLFLLTNLILLAAPFVCCFKYDILHPVIQQFVYFATILPYQYCWWITRIQSIVFRFLKSSWFFVRKGVVIYKYQYFRLPSPHLTILCVHDFYENVLLEKIIYH